MTKKPFIDFIKLAFKNNNFYLVKKIFNQVFQAAIGTKYSPGYACLIIEQQEEKLNFSSGFTEVHKLVKAVFKLYIYDEFFFVFLAKHFDLSKQFPPCY